MIEPDQFLLDLVSRSGYPFQIAVAQAVQKRWGIHEADWQVVVTEHHWMNMLAGASGFIDLLLARNDQRVVIECKREMDETWIFLNPEEHPETPWAKVYGAERYLPNCGWVDHYADPYSFTSSYCVKKGENRQPLEKQCRDLILSVESVAEQEISSLRNQDDPSRPGRLFYIPMIVTSAQLKVAHFTLDNVRLDTGTVLDGNMTDAPYVRFTKSLVAVPEQVGDRDLQAINAASQRTVFIVQVLRLIEFLQAWRRGSRM